MGPWALHQIKTPNDRRLVQLRARSLSCVLFKSGETAVAQWPTHLLSTWGPRFKACHLQLKVLKWKVLGSTLPATVDKADLLGLLT